MDHLFCFGLGYCAEVLARRWLAAGFRVSGTVREAAQRDRLAAWGIESHFFDGRAPLDSGMLAGVTHILVSAPPDADGDPLLRVAGTALAGAAGLRWVGYLSSTGVYGDWGGALVDEDSPLRAASSRAQARARAERDWLATGLPVDLFRLAGIYGPGRNALKELRAGRARRIYKDGQKFGRIHVEDIATVLAAAAARGTAGRIYNVSDDEPAPPDEVIAYAAGLLGVDPGPRIAFEQAALSPMAASFWADNRRVANRRMKEELAVRLAFPTYREGLSALFAAGE